MLIRDSVANRLALGGRTGKTQPERQNRLGCSVAPHCTWAPVDLAAPVGGKATKQRLEQGSGAGLIRTVTHFLEHHFGPIQKSPGSMSAARQGDHERGGE
jgi:hypothetical protein